MIEMANIAYSSLTLSVPGIFENPRLKAAASGIKELAASIEANGLMNPLQVWEYADAEGKVQFVVLGGSRRYQALGQLIERGVFEADMTVPCRMINVDVVSDARSAALIDNIQREALSPFEMAKEIYELRANGVTGADLAKKLGKSAAWVSRHYTTWRDTDAEVKRLWRKGALTTDEVQQLSKLPLEEQAAHATELVELRGKEHVGKADMAGRVKARGKIKEMKAKRSPKRSPKPQDDDGDGDELDAELDDESDERARSRDAAEEPVVTAAGKKFESKLPDPAEFVLGRKSIDMLLDRVKPEFEESEQADPYLVGVYDALRYVTAQMPFGSLSDKIREAIAAASGQRKAG